MPWHSNTLWNSNTLGHSNALGNSDALRNRDTSWDCNLTNSLDRDLSALSVNLLLALGNNFNARSNNSKRCNWASSKSKRCNWGSSKM